MRSPLLITTVILIIAGFAIPILWAGAIVTAFLATAASPGGVRADGKKKSGGLFGPVIDDIAVSMNTKKCPYCEKKKKKTVKKCPHCAEWLVER